MLKAGVEEERRGEEMPGALFSSSSLSTMMACRGGERGKRERPLYVSGSMGSRGHLLITGQQRERDRKNGTEGKWVGNCGVA